LFFASQRGTTESGVLKANTLPGRPRRLAVGAVKGAQFAFIERSERPLTEAGGTGAGFQQEGQNKVGNYQGRFALTIRFITESDRAIDGT
jgi:hypothetical protein